MHDFVVIGGGIIGLSLAWELARRNQSVCVVEKQAMGRATSWGGAGIFPPPRTKAAHDPLEQLRAAAHQLHQDWAARLLAETGIDNQLRCSGGLYFARRPGEAAALRVDMQQAAHEGVRVETLENVSFLDREPSLRSIADQIQVAFELPDEMQLRAPPHLNALIQACRQNGVTFHVDTQAKHFTTRGDEIECLETSTGSVRGRQYCVCNGPWAAGLFQPLGIVLPVEPWRGQLVIWDCEQAWFRRVINEGLRYFVPREDGVLLVGATVEDVGFDLQTTDDALDELVRYSREILPQLDNSHPKKIWAGLRPKTPDGYPIMGRVPGFANLSVSAGHFRSGLHLSPASAVFMASILLDDTPPQDPNKFQLQR